MSPGVFLAEGIYIKTSMINKLENIDIGPMNKRLYVPKITNRYESIGYS